MEIMMGSADARKVLSDIFESLPKHRRAVIEEILARISHHHVKIIIRIKEGCVERDVWPMRNKIWDLHRVGQTGWPEQLNVHVEMNPKKRPYVTEMGKSLRWLKKMGVNEFTKVEWGPLCSIAKV